MEATQTAGIMKDAIQTQSEDDTREWSSSSRKPRYGIWEHSIKQANVSRYGGSWRI